jgi:hypothetical protein
MTDNIKKMKDLALPLPITQTVRKTAKQFAEQQPTPEKAAQVYLNTLAVCVVNDYLQLMGINTNLAVSDSWNPVVRLCADVADLEVPEVGRLECRPIQGNPQSCQIPPEVWQDRVGYVVVQINESFREATLLGFAPGVAIADLPINQLQPLENLLEHLSQIRCSSKVSDCITANETLVNLGQWFQNLFQVGWQTAEALLNSTETRPAFNFRSVDSSSVASPDQSEARVRRAKLIDLRMQGVGYFVALIIELSAGIEQNTDVCLQVHPTGSQTYLPPNLQLIILDESGAVFRQAQARRADNYIQLQFNGKSGERFSIRVILGDISLTENFML